MGIILAVSQFYAGHGGVCRAVLSILLLSADFFLPMRQLGSYFHIAMNGMAASDKIFHLLDLPEPDCKTAQTDGKQRFPLLQPYLRFSYTEDRPILKGCTIEFPDGSFIGIAGESGCGKVNGGILL